MKTVYVLFADTESGDEYFWVFDYLPDQMEVETFLKVNLPNEDHDYISWQIEEDTLKTKGE